ncbi:MAG TPA: family 16 glycosylhydrolase [Bacteroidia bacterium]|nr:family 16 glycosylhydrolase [Bacteroidia bacterium]
MKNIIFIVLLYSIIPSLFSQTPGAFPRILSKPKQACDNEVKVKDLYTSNCNYEANCNYLYPVLIEEFDYNFDLPNKWRFDYGYTQDDNGAGTTWHGDAYTSSTFGPNHNIQLNNGIATFLNIQETVTRNNNGTDKNFKFTSGMIASLSRFRTGVFEARIKIPSANKMWPAFWLLFTKSNYSEIDIFEFYDDNVGSNPGSNSNCDTYNLHKMSIHGGASGNDCHRSDKYPLNINVFHDYKLVWNDYETFIYVDGAFKGYATRYLRNTTLPVIPCQYGYSGNYFDPAENYNCNQIQYMPDNLFPTIPYIDWGPRPWWLPNAISWPPPQPPQPYLANKLRQDSYFPEKDNAMFLILNNNINAEAYKDDDFSNFSQSSLNMEVDWIKVYQPFCCGVDKTVCSLTDLDNQTYYTDILTGRKLSVGYANNSCNFLQFKPGTGGNYRDVPVILLATDEIAIQGEAIFAGDTYAEMRITDCGSTARMNNSELKQVEDFYQNQQSIMDSIAKNNIQNSDSIAKSEYENTMKKYKELYYVEDGENINIGPIPALDYIDILCSNTVYEKIVSLSLIDMNGKESVLPVQHMVNIEHLKSGFYQLKIRFNDGSIVVKKVVKT